MGPFLAALLRRVFTSAAITSIMSLKHVIFLFIVTNFLLCVSEAAKKNKAAAKKGKNKNKVRPVEPGGSAEYIPEPDVQFWQPGGHIWTWDADRDTPFKNEEWQQFWTDLNATLHISGFSKLSPHYYDEVRKWLNSGVRIAYLDLESTVLSTIYMAHVKTENGENIPPILGQMCTLEQCTDPTLSYDWQSQIDPQDFLNLHEISELEKLYDQFMDQWQILSKTFAPEEARATICQEAYVMTTKYTVEARIDTLEQEYAGFLENPGTSGRPKANKYLQKVHNVTIGKLLLNLMGSMCKNKKNKS